MRLVFVRGRLRGSGESAILHRPPYLIARGPKDDSPVNSRKLSIYWVSVKVAPRISGDLHGHACRQLLAKV